MTATGWGIIGCGWAAGDMCAALGRLNTPVAAVFDRVEERARELGERHGATVHASLEEVLADDAVEVAYIALPHHLLAPTAELALAAGKHVLVEKPMALEVHAIRSLARLADERERVLAPVFELRAAPVFVEARRLLLTGAIGTVKAVRIRTTIDKPSHYWSSGPTGLVHDGWRARRETAGGGVVLMNAIHQLDLVRHLTGLEIVSVVAETATLYADVEVEDCAAAVLRFDNDALGSLVASAHSPGAAAEERIELDGSLGRIDLPHPSESARPRLFLRRPWNDLRAGEWIALDAPDGDPYLEYLRAFNAAVQGVGPPPAEPADAAAALGAVLAIYEAASRGCRVAVGG
jgi:predicted dehydrogenase